MENEKKSSVMMWVAFGYLALPFLIFVAGWFRIYFAIPIIIIVLAGLFFACKHSPRLWIPTFDRTSRINTIVKIAVIAVIALVWLYFSGIGGYAFQNYDHGWRNGIFNLLVEEEWPVVITETAGYFDGPVAFVYYFAFWLPAAVIGKLFGLAAGYAFQFIWAFIGIMLLFFFISSLRKKLSVWPCVLFIAFSGLDIVGMLALGNSHDFSWLNSSHIENWAWGFQYSSFTTQLFWVFNQALPAWLITLMLLHQEDNRSLVFLYSFSLLSCTLPAVGMIPLFVYVAVRNCVKHYDKSKNIKKNTVGIIREIFTFQNVAAGGVIGISSYLFLKINSSGNKFAVIDMKNYFMSYLLFVFFEFLIYYLLIYKAEHRRPIYYISLGVLLLIPLFRVGSSIDFVMRASIPALVVLYMLVVDAIDKYRIGKQHVLMVALVIALALGSVTVQHEFERSAVNTVEAQKNDKDPTSPARDLISDPLRNNFFGSTDNSFFFRYIARK